jgi:hypothetical protein
MSKPICETYWKIENAAYEMKLSVSKGIVIVNLIFRKIIIEVMRTTGSHTESKVSRHTITVIFLCVFFNTGIFILISNANLTSQYIPILSKLLGNKGIYSDFTT